jgi:hypothetical protein
MVNIDTVYQRVLAIANKEQRGYITPQEFNLFANQAQVEIFEQYFYDENQFGRIAGNSTEYSDMLDLLKEKIALFKVSEELPVSQILTGGGTASMPIGMYRLGDIYIDNYKLERVEENELSVIQNSIITPSIKRPVYTANDDRFVFYSGSSMIINSQFDVKITYVRMPNAVNWSYSVIDEHALYDPTYALDFELHNSEETSLVMKILSLAGITLKDNTLYQAGQTSELKKIQQEKQ